jgi:heme peroxidase
LSRRLVSVRNHCLSPSRAHLSVDAPTASQRYGRMFPQVAPFTSDEAFLLALGRAGGVCDCGDDADTPQSDARVAAGWPIFGQFVAHDITADRSALHIHVDPSRLQNARTPRLNLESVYGDGPVGHPFLFERDDPAKCLLGDQGGDVPRNAEGLALIGDPRDDSHMLVSQFHLAVLKLHNAFVDRARSSGAPESQIFPDASRLTRWSIQWIIVNEFLPTLVGQQLAQEAVDQGPLYFNVREPFIPLEFADAAYRYGHCQIRHRYQLNRDAEAVSLFPDLLGFRRVPPERRVDWRLFFDGKGNRAQRAKKIDGRLVRGLIELPVAITGECEIEEYHSLAVRDLQRGQGVALPSGEALSRHLDIEPLTPSEVGLTSMGWSGETPLWYYLLREADVRSDGDRLGPLGGRIVAEVLVGLLKADSSSYLNAAEPGWAPPFASADASPIAQMLAWDGRIG